jgi:hypothetical protein
LVGTLILRASIAQPTRAFDFARIHLLAGAASILDEHEISVTTSRSGYLIALVSILIDALELPYDARALTRELITPSGRNSRLG